MITVQDVIAVSRSLERARVRVVWLHDRLGSTQWDTLVAGLELARQHRLLEPDVAT